MTAVVLSPCVSLRWHPLVFPLGEGEGMGPLCEGDVLPLPSPLDSRLRGNDVWCARND